MLVAGRERAHPGCGRIRGGDGQQRGVLAAHGGLDHRHERLRREVTPVSQLVRTRTGAVPGGGPRQYRNHAAGLVADQVDPVQPEVLAQVHVSWAIAVTDGSSRGGVPPCSGRSTGMPRVVPSTCSMTCRHSAPWWPVRRRTRPRPGAGLRVGSVTGGSRQRLAACGEFRDIHVRTFFLVWRGFRRSWNQTFCLSVR